MNKHLERITTYLKNKLFVKTSSQNRYIKRFYNRSINLLVLLSIVVCLFFGLLIICKGMWYLYQHTPVGQQYHRIFSNYSQSISDIFNSNLFLLSLDITLITFLSSLTICCIFQLLHITSFFYLPRGFMGRIIFFGFPFAYASALIIQNKYNLQSIEMACSLALIPTLCVFVYCFEYTIHLLPRASEIVIEAKLAINKTINKFSKYENDE